MSVAAGKRRVRVALTTRIPVTNAGGIESSVRDIAPRIAAKRPGWDVRVVNAFGRIAGWNSIPLVGDLLAAVSLALKVARFDVVLVNGGEYAWPRMLRGRDRAKTIVVWHGTRAGEIPMLAQRMSLPIEIYRFAETWLQGWALRARGQIAVSGSTARELAAAYGRLPRLHVVPNGAPDVEVAERSERSGRRVVWIGTNAYKKGLDVALAACERARGVHTDLELIVVGLAAGGGIDPPWVTYTGRVDRAVSLEWLRSADVMLATSRYEGCSVAIVEAMALGIPIVAGPAVSWMVGAAGVAVDTFSSERFAVTLAALLETPEILAAMAQEGPRQAKRFDWNSAADAYVGEVERCLHVS